MIAGNEKVVEMTEQQITNLVTEIISRLAQHIGADGHKGSVVAVFTGATVGFTHACAQVRNLVLNGYAIQLVLSDAAENIYGNTLREELAGFPHISQLDTDKWYQALTGATGLVVPMLSLNTASRVAQLLADTIPANLMMHALSLGKPVIAAVNGADPADVHWARRAGQRTVKPALCQAMQDRLQLLRDYGCHLVDVQQLCAGFCACSGNGSKEIISAVQTARNEQRTKKSIYRIHGRLVTASHVQRARTTGQNIVVAQGTVVTPLAKEMAVQHGIRLIRE
ncbi:flavoprotein [Desulfogranum japonicum]|uniref:flavoprotein n=1 Tax=Desulfogranum japonicum TaxID=231447 RepID=UPI000420002E|nr:flavoprotein [Desulfogranum japonicum]